MQELLQQHQADVMTEQHHSEAVCQQASELRHTHHTTSAPCQPAQTHMPIWHKVINRLVKVAELAHSLREDIMMQAVSAVHVRLNTHNSRCPFMV